MLKSQLLSPVALSIVVASSLSACARKTDLSVAAQVAPEYASSVEAAVGGINNALSDPERSANVALNHYQPGQVTSSWLIHEAYASSCGIGRFSPSIGSANCAGSAGDKTVHSQFNACTVGGADQYALNGTVVLTFDTPSTCDSWINGGALPSSGSVTRTSSNFSRVNPDGSQVTTNSDAHSNYRNEAVAGGVKTNFSVGSRSVEILGLHRMRYGSLGRIQFDHSVVTTAPIVVTGTWVDGNRAIVSGAIRVDHNLAKFSSTTVLTGIQWASSCCHPVHGQISFGLSGSRNGNLAADFNTGSCGLVNLTLPSGKTEKLQLSSCD